MEKIFEAMMDGELKEGVVVSPSPEDIEEGQIVYTKTFRQAVDGGAYLGKKLASVLIEQGLWTEEKEKRIVLLRLYIKKFENKLKDKEQTEDEARESAKKLREYREELHELVVEQNSFSEQTAEGQADNKRFSFLCSRCILDKETRKPYFSSLEDYLKNGNTEFGVEGTKQFSFMMNQIDPEYEEKLPENIFFRRFGEGNVELTEEDKEFQELIAEVVETEEPETDMETIEYKPVKKKRTRKKKVSQ